MKNCIERNEFFGKIIYDTISNSIELEYRDINLKEKQAHYLTGPTNVFLELTSACNLHCKHCFNSNQKEDSILALEFWKDVIDQLAKMKVFFVKITGGEPFLYPYFFDILNHLETANINYIIYTNGLFIQQNIQKLIPLKHLLVIRVSLEGTREYNDQIRGSGVFDEVINALILLDKYGIKNAINYTINRSNYSLLLNLEKYILHTCNLTTPIHIGLIKHAGNSLSNNDLCFWDNDEYKNVLKFIKHIVETSDLIEPLFMLPEYYYEIYGKHFGCPAAQTSMVIKCNGTVVPCGLMPITEFTNCGNIQNISLQNIWHGDKMNTFRNLKPPLKCISCKEYLLNCTGACRANALNIYNNINGADINCDVYKTSLARPRRK